MKIRSVLVVSLALTACDKPSERTPPECSPAPAVSVLARPGTVGADGAATVYGTTRFAPRANGGEDSTSSPLTERAVHDVYVAGARVTQAEFNFRSWSVVVDEDRLCAFTPVGSRQASLSVRVYLAGPDGVCAYDVSDPLVVELPEGSCAADAGAILDAGP